MRSVCRTSVGASATGASVSRHRGVLVRHRRHDRRRGRLARAADRRPCGRRSSTKTRSAPSTISSSSDEIISTPRPWSASSLDQRLDLRPWRRRRCRASARRGSAAWGRCKASAPAEPSAGCRRTARGSSARCSTALIARRVDEPVDDRALAAPRRRRPCATSRGRMRERDVLAHRHVGNDAVRLAVLGAIADAERDRLGGLARRDRPGPSAESTPASGGSAPKIARAVFGPARAEQAGEADDLAGAHLEPHVAAPCCPICRALGRRAPRRRPLPSRRGNPVARLAHRLDDRGRASPR